MTTSTDGGRGAWAQPGVQELAPGLLRIPLPLPNDGLRAVNVYALTDADGLTLIDAGWALEQSEQQLAAALGSRGLELGDIRRFLVTHMHRDHYTQAVTLRRRFGARVGLGAGEQPNLQALLQPPAGPVPPMYRTLLAAGAHEMLDEVAQLGHDGLARDPDHWAEPDEWLAAEQLITVGDRQLRVVPTPGHTRGHVVYVDDAAAVMFTGDHVLPQITPSIGLEPVRPDYPLRDFLTSLQLVRALPDMRLLPAHGPVAPSTHARVDELIDHHERRLARSLELARAGRHTAFDVARAMTWTRREHALLDMDLFNRTLAVGETAAHLDVLVLRGELSAKTGDDGVVHYA